ncbi:MAG TPA: hypothetical protein PKD85_11250 [Saprospiraceae bacterium]|nr:hypothetical protein [Saprospiraceae bacterium]
MTKIITIAFFLLVLYSNSFTQNYQFKTIGIKEGLDAADLYNPAIDPNGFLWVATSNGIYSYDGVNVSHFTQERYPDLPSDGVGNIQFDPKGRLWIKSLSGIAILEKNGLFTQVNKSENFKTIGIFFQINTGPLIINANNILLYDESTGQSEELLYFKSFFQDKIINYFWNIDFEKFLVRSTANEYFLIISQGHKAFDIQRIEIDKIISVNYFDDESIYLLADGGKSLYLFLPIKKLK